MVGLIRTDKQWLRKYNRKLIFTKDIKQSHSLGYISCFLLKEFYTSLWRPVGILLVAVGDRIIR